MTSFLPLLVALLSCATPAPAPVPQRPVAARGPRRARPAGPRAAAGPAIGVAGPVMGELELKAEEPPAGGAPTPPQPRTTASLALEFSDGSRETVQLGQVDGTCAEAETRPVGPPGHEIMSLWTVDCTSAAGPTEVHLVQKGSLLLVARAQPNGGAKPTLKVVKRIALAPGAVVARKTDPGAAAPAPAPAPAP